MMMTPIAIYGAGGFGRETAWLIDTCRQAGEAIEAVCYIDDDPKRWGEVQHGLPIVGLAEAAKHYTEAKVVVAIGNSTTRSKLAQKATAAGFGFHTLIHPGAKHSSRVIFGEGTVVCAGCILTTDIVLGRHVQLNPGCTIGHDVRMGDFCSLAPGVNVAGFVQLGARVYVGIGAVIINGNEASPLEIGADAVIGAGACVIRAVEAGATVVGVPAKRLPH